VEKEALILALNHPRGQRSRPEKQQFLLFHGPQMEFEHEHLALQPSLNSLELNSHIADLGERHLYLLESWQQAKHQQLGLKALERAAP
jgi:hypothetical protein